MREIAAMEAAYAKVMADPHWQALMEEGSSTVESMRIELYEPLDEKKDPLTHQRVGVRAMLSTLPSPTYRLIVCRERSSEPMQRPDER